jgi:hypothetical protein
VRRKSGPSFRGPGAAFRSAESLGATFEELVWPDAFSLPLDFPLVSDFKFGWHPEVYPLLNQGEKVRQTSLTWGIDLVSLFTEAFENWADRSVVAFQDDVLRQRGWLTQQKAALTEILRNNDLRRSLLAVFVSEQAKAA